ncbi:hypothetical protein Tco_1046929 [Tanacetum coccineum]
MLESKAFKTYRDYVTGEKAPKSKATKKKNDFESSPKTKPSQASKGKRIKTSAKGDKRATTKSKGLTVLSEVALSEAEQMKFSMSNNKPDLSREDEEEDEEHDSDDDNDDNDNDDVTFNQKVSTPHDYELTEEDENKQDDDTIGEEQGDEDNWELYGDLNINLSRSDAEMTDAQTNPETEEA